MFSDNVIIIIIINEKIIVAFVSPLQTMNNSVFEIYSTTF